MIIQGISRGTITAIIEESDGIGLIGKKFIAMGEYFRSYNCDGFQVHKLYWLVHNDDASVAITMEDIHEDSIIPVLIAACKAQHDVDIGK